jgi:hypothetical protein
MNIKVAWDNEDKTVIRYDFEGPWTWDDFRIAAEKAFAMTRSVEHTVDTISNFFPGVLLPANAMFHFRRVMEDAPKNRGVNVIVGSSAFIRTMVMMFSSVNRQLAKRIIIVDRLDQARAALAERRREV